MYQYNVKILRIVDGDTVDVDVDLGFGVWIHKERVRFHGIDTPESRTRDLEEKKFGLLSKEYVKSLLPIGSHQTLVCKTYDSKGKFGRILGDFEVYNNKKDCVTSLVQDMIESGYGVHYEGQSKESIQEQHITNRKRLIEEGIISDA